MRTKITQAVQEAQKGSRKVKIIFKRDAIGDINYLLGMCRDGIISLNDSDSHVLWTILRERNWDVDSNRTVIVTLTAKFEEEWFVGRLWRALEKIEAVN